MTSWIKRLGFLPLAGLVGWSSFQLLGETRQAQAMCWRSDSGGVNPATGCAGSCMAPIGDEDCVIKAVTRKGPIFGPYTLYQCQGVGSFCGWTPWEIFNPRL